MVFSDLVGNPPETTLITTILGVLLSQGLTVAELGVLGRIIIYFGEAVLTIAVLQAAKDAEEIEKVKQNKLLAMEHDNVTSVDNDETTILLDSIYVIIKQLQQQNQNLQEQIWILQEKMPIK